MDQGYKHRPEFAWVSKTNPRVSRICDVAACEKKWDRRCTNCELHFCKYHENEHLLDIGSKKWCKSCTLRIQEDIRLALAAEEKSK